MTGYREKDLDVVPLIPVLIVAYQPKGSYRVIVTLGWWRMVFSLEMGRRLT